MNKLIKVLIISLFSIFNFGIINCYSQTSDENIDMIIVQKQKFNQENKNSTVFKVQIYNGVEDEAYKMERNFELEFPDYTVTVVYNKPEFKTQVGYFKTRLEADRALKIIKEKFAGAIVLEDKI
jgi:hypothetical protein